MSAEEAFKLLALVRQEADSARQLDKAEQLNAEYRRLVQAQVHALTAARALTWADIQHCYTRIRDKADVAGHQCGDTHCRPSALRVGYQFVDPARTERRYTATGNIWICAVSLRRHVCDAYSVCEFSQASHGSRICTMTGLDKGVVPISVPHLATPAAVNAAVRQAVSTEVYAQCKMSSSSSGRKRAQPKKLAQKLAVRHVRHKAGGEQGYELVARLDSGPSQHMSNEIHSICERLFSAENGVARVCLDVMQSAIVAMNAELQKRLSQPRALGFADIALLVSQHGSAPLKALIEIAPSLKCTRSLARADLMYLGDAVARLLHLLQLTPKINDGCNSVSAKGARAHDMAVPLLMVMRDGLVGLVDRTDGSIRTCTHAQAELDRVAVTNVDADYERHVFVPAHPALRHFLPTALPQGASGVITELYQHAQAHDNRVHTSFDSVLSKPGVEPHRYCLDTYMTTRADVLSNLLLSHQ
jgi:hypothetical protein